MILPQVSIFNFLNFILTQKWRLKAQSGKKIKPSFLITIHSHKLQTANNKKISNGEKIKMK